MPKSPKKALEFYYRDGPLRADEILHEDILADGDDAAAKAISDKVARKLGLSEQQIAALKPKGQ